MPEDKREEAISLGKQTLMFDSGAATQERKYTTKIEAPVYEPRHTKPHVLTLCDPSKTRRLIRDIDESNLPEDEKAFLRLAAYRHAVFNYERIADYYAHSGPETQRLMEQSALIIIDFDKAIEQGFVQLCEDIRKQYLEEYGGNSEADKED
jgi:hypothetical protein